MYTQITSEERYTIARCRVARMSVAAIAAITGRHRSTINREIARSRCNFHGYKQIEKLTNVVFYFAKPYHSCERGLNENTNGLIRQHLPKGKSMADLTQWGCIRIAEKLNNRPKKRLGFRTPKECYDSD